MLPILSIRRREEDDVASNSFELMLGSYWLTGDQSAASWLITLVAFDGSNIASAGRFVQCNINMEDMRPAQTVVSRSSGGRGTSRAAADQRSAGEALVLSCKSGAR